MENKPAFATKTKMANDIFWDYYTPSKRIGGKLMTGEVLRWVGYNDAYWWNNVANNTHFTQQVDSNGYSWELNPKTNEVKQLNPS